LLYSIKISHYSYDQGVDKNKGFLRYWNAFGTVKEQLLDMFTL